MDNPYRVALLACVLFVSCKGDAAQGDRGAQAAAEAGAPRLDLPTVELPRAQSSHGNPAIWIDRHAIWTGRLGGAPPTQVMPIKDAGAGAPELLEPLAERLDALRTELRAEQIILIESRNPLVLLADARTPGATLRRVLTTARATDLREITYIAAGDPSPGVRLTAAPPIADPDAGMEQVLEVRLEDDEITLNGQAVTKAQLPEALARQLQFRAQKCVDLPSDELDYAAWMTFVADIVTAGADCLTVPAEPASDRVAHWWERANAAYRAEQDARDATRSR